MPPPRNSCTDCRLRKVKCLLQGGNTRCDRCILRNIACSYEQRPPLGRQDKHDHQKTDLRFDPARIASNSSKWVDGRSPHHYRLDDTQTMLDIGQGTPAEILREGELTHSILLLYFGNFSDVHFMFDQEMFMRQVSLGEAPKVLLFSMMALGIKYSQAPFEDYPNRAHRGEILFSYARKLLKDDFDHPSVTTIQAYVLLATYHLTFGGSRKAWMYLSMASSITKLLRLTEESWEVDILQKELTRRLVCTIVLMDRSLSPSLNLSCLFPSNSLFPLPCSDAEFRGMVNRTSSQPSDVQQPSLTGYIFKLSRLYCQICLYHRHGDTTLLHDFAAEKAKWLSSLPGSVRLNHENLEKYRTSQLLRPFVYMHLLYHHISQLALFWSLKGNASTSPGPAFDRHQNECHEHARIISDTIQYTWEQAGFDLHNPSIGQILTVAAVVHTHSLLTTSSVEVMEACKTRIVQIRDCIGRIKQHCRLFKWVSAQLETFLRICSQSCVSSDPNLFDRNEGLIRQILQFGTHYERLNPQTAGTFDGLEALANSTFELPFATVESPGFLSDNYLSWLASNAGPQNQALENTAWMFSDASLVDLYSMSYM